MSDRPGPSTPAQSRTRRMRAALVAAAVALGGAALLRRDFAPHSRPGRVSSRWTVVHGCRLHARVPAANAPADAPVVSQRRAEEVGRLLPGGPHALNHGAAKALVCAVRPFLDDGEGTEPMQKMAVQPKRVLRSMRTPGKAAGSMVPPRWTDST